jgi:hypothetical protein
MARNISADRTVVAGNPARVMRLVSPEVII